MRPHYTTEQIIAAFWAKVDKTPGCWLWRAGTDRAGYGRFNAAGRSYAAHRFSWELTNGPVPEADDDEEPIFVLHNCPGGDNPACVNPAHLWLGTQAENIEDMCRKGRAASGERNGSHTHPESIRRGETHPWHTSPERIPRGERHHRTSLTDEQVREMRALHATGTVTQAALAQHFGISHKTVHGIIRRHRWTHIE